MKIFTEGLDWSASDDNPSPEPAKTASVPTADDIEAEATRAVQNALKNLPKGLRF